MLLPMSPEARTLTKVINTGMRFCYRIGTF